MSTDTTQAGAATSGTSFWASSRLVAEREINSQIRTKGFWITLGLFVVGLFAMTILPGLFGGGQPSVAVAGNEAERVVAAAGFEVETVADQSAAEELVRAGDVDAAVVTAPSGESPLGLRVIGLSEVPQDVVAALSVAPPVDLLEPSTVADGFRFLVPFVFAAIFFIFAIGSGMAIAQSVVTEKQTRIVEILVATVPVRALLTGKILGHSLLVFGQVAVLALLTPLALRLGGETELLTALSGPLTWFVPFFVIGFVLLAALWATAGALVSRQEDLGSSTSVVMTAVMLPYFGVVFFYDNALVMTILSYVPFSASVAMPARLFTGDAQPWEAFVSLGVLGAALVVCVLVASRIYSGSLLQTGGKVKLGRAWAHAD